jgi:hypothetical protein
MDNREALFKDCVEILSLLEKEMPPSFFDIMVHLTIHLVEELFICGPVHVRWMYPYERYYKTLKSFVVTSQNRRVASQRGTRLKKRWDSRLSTWPNTRPPLEGYGTAKRIPV